jgi:hypothetical protein
MFAPLDGLSGADAGDAGAWSASSAPEANAEGGEGASGAQADASVPPADARDEDASTSTVDAGGGSEAGDESPPLAPIAFVQVAVSTPANSVSSVSTTFAQPQSVGNLNVVAIGWNDTTGAVSSVTDSSGNVYQLAVGPTRLPPDLTQSIYYAPNIVAADAATNIVTVAFVNTANVADLRAVEYSGLDPVAPFDAATDGSGNNAGPAKSGMVSTTAPRSLLFGAGMTTDVFTAPGAGYTMRTVTSDGDMVEDEIVSSSGSYDAQASLSSSSRWVIQVAAFH